MKKIKHIFFDLDHTLWDFEKNSREAILSLFNQHPVFSLFAIEFDAFIGIYEAINHNLWNQYLLQQITKEELRYQRFYKTFLYFNVDNEELARLWANEYVFISPYKTNLMEGTTEVLSYLKEKNYTLHIITNGFKEVQHIKLTQSKLKDFFHHTIISEEHGLSKPDIRLFKLAQKLADAAPAECIMIGDSYENDIAGALNAQWKAVHFSQQNRQKYHADYYRINALQELKELL